MFFKVCLIFLKRRGKEKDEGSDGAKTSDREEKSSEVSVGGGNKVGSVDSGLNDGSINHHLGCRGGAASHANSLGGWGREGRSGSNEESEKEEGTHLEIVILG
eukprot:825198_1